MIEINLSPREKENQLANFGGINFSLINLKMLVLSFLILYGIEPFLLDYFAEENENLVAKQNEVRKQQRQISTQLEELKHVKKQVEDLNRQETALSQRVSVVKKIVDKRQNPFKVLKYVAQNTPSDVWLTEIVLEERRLTLVGYSKTWKSISDFLSNLKSSVFFNQGINYNRTGGVEGTFQGQRVEPFTINATVETFE